MAIQRKIDNERAGQIRMAFHSLSRLFGLDLDISQLVFF